MTDLSGQTIKGYVLRERLGEGPYGIVYRAHHPVTARDVAVKIIPARFANQPDFVRRFEPEARRTAGLNHPHIAPLYDYWRDPGGAYLVTRWLPDSVRRALEREVWSLPAAARLAGDVCSALSFAHNHGVCHGSFKLSNILLDEDRNAYLCDFVRPPLLLAPDQRVPPDPDQLLCIAPEQLRSGEPSYRADVYGLGMLLISVLAPAALPTRIAAAVPPSDLWRELMRGLRVARPDLPTALFTLIQTATATNPADRYADAAQMGAAFGNALETSPELAYGAPEALGKRELAILRLMANDLNTAQMAERLSLSSETVRWYVKRLYSKLDVHSRNQAVQRAHELRLYGQAGGAESSGAGRSSPVILTLPIMASPLKNPYKGLRAFQESDAPDFFGREALTEQLLARLAEGGPCSRFLAVVGPSGSGKSSAVRAGLIPALRRGALPGSEQWFIAQMLPGSRPLEEIEIALTSIAVRSLPTMLDELRRDVRGLLRMTRLVLPTAESELVLVVDQFEEVFTLGGNVADQLHFLDSLYIAVTDPHSTLRLVAALRADFFDRPLIHEGFSKLLSERTHIVGPLGTEEMERAIVLPAQRVGVLPEDGLATVISADVSQQPGALPLLQYALTELFERREDSHLTLRAYQDMKGVRGALARRAEEVYTQLRADEQQAAKQVFLRLVTLGEGIEDTRRRVPLAELQGLGDADTVHGVMDVFDRARLLTFDRDPGASGPTVELAHEAILREWSRLRGWLDESRTDVRLERLLNTATADWLAVGREVSYLLHGGRLAMYTSWRQSTSVALTGDEAAYVDASMRHEQRQMALRRRLRRLAFGVTVAVAVMMSVLALLARIGQAQAERQATVNRSLVLASAAEDANAAGQVDLALLLALEAVRIPEPPHEAAATLRYLAFDIGVRAALRTQGNEILAVAFSADGARALSGGCARVLGSACIESELVEWRLDDNGQARFTGENSGWVTGVAFSPDGRLVLSGDSNGLAVLWDAATQRALFRLEGHRGAVRQALFSPDGRKALTAAGDGSLIVWDVPTGQVVHRLDWHNTPVTACAFSPDGRIIASGAQDGLILIWDMNTGTVINRLRGHAAGITGLAFRAVGNGPPTLLSTSLDGTIREWDTAREVELHQAVLILSPLGLAVLPGPSEVLFYTRFWIGLYDPDRTVMKRLVYSPWGALSGMAVSPDAKHFLIGHTGGALTLENMPVADLIKRHDADVPVIWADLSPDGNRLLAGSMSGGAALMWDLATGGELWRRNGLENIVTGGFSPDGKQLLIASSDWLAGTANTSYALADAATGRTLHTLVGHEYAYRSHLFDHDGSTLYTGSFAWGAGFADEEGQGELIAWDVATGALVRRFDVGAAVPGIALSPDDSLLFVTAMTYGPMKLLDTATGNVLRAFSDLRNVPDDEAEISVPAGGYGVIWGPDDHSVIYGSGSGDLVQLDVETGEVLRVFHGHDKPAFSLAHSPDWRYLLSGDAGSPGQIILWDYASGQELRRFLGHTAPVVRVLFSPDGQSAFSAGYDGVILQWRIEERTLDQLLTWVNENRYVRQLTCEERRYYNILPLCTVNAP